MLGSKPVTVTRVPHLSAEASVVTVVVRGFGRPFVGKPSVHKCHYDTTIDRNGNYYDGKEKYNSRHHAATITRETDHFHIQHRTNTSGWYSFLDSNFKGHAFSGDASVVATYRLDDGSLGVFEGTLAEFFAS